MPMPRAASSVGASTLLSPTIVLRSTGSRPYMVITGKPVPRPKPKMGTKQAEQRDAGDGEPHRQRRRSTRPSGQLAAVDQHPQQDAEDGGEQST